MLDGRVEMAAAFFVILNLLVPVASNITFDPNTYQLFGRKADWSWL
jgi:hypothetical protein